MNSPEGRNSGTDSWAQDLPLYTPCTHNRQCPVASDIAIGAIYSHMTRRQQLAVSDLMYGSKGRDLEEILPEFTQSV